MEAKAAGIEALSWSPVRHDRVARRREEHTLHGAGSGLPTGLRLIDHTIHLRLEDDAINPMVRLSHRRSGK